MGNDCFVSTVLKELAQGKTFDEAMAIAEEKHGCETVPPLPQGDLGQVGDTDPAGDL